MKPFAASFIFFVIPRMLLSQNVGIGTNTPGQKLEVNGGVKVGTAGTNTAGTIRYNSGRFEGGDGTNWKSLEGVPAGTIVCSSTYPNTTLESNGFTLTGYIETATAGTTSYSNVTANTWLKISRMGNFAPASYNPFMFWTGSKVIVFGGQGTSSSDAGWLYDPVADDWTQMSTTGVPSIFSTSMQNTYAVWSGTEMIVYNTSQSTGGRYNPSTNTWTSISNVNDPSSRTHATAIWTGTEMIIWGGNTGGSSVTNTGSRYNPSTNTWTTIPTASAPEARGYHTAIWTGTDMIVWGGQGTGPRLNTGGRYNPTLNLWGSVSTTNAPAARDYHTAIWTGTEMIIWGGSDGSGSPSLNTGGKFNPSTNTWTSISSPTIGRSCHSAVWTGTDMLIWGGSDIGGGSPNLAYNTVGRYIVSSDTWTSIAATSSTPCERFWHSAVWANNVMIVWGGEDINSESLNSGGRFYPSSVTGINTVEDKAARLHLYIKN